MPGIRAALSRAGAWTARARTALPALTRHARTALPTLLALFALVVNTALSPAYAQAAAPKVLVIGDSLSAGYGLAPGQGWVDLLQKKLAASGHAHKVVNASISGDTTAGGRSRVGPALTLHKPEIVIIELGGNDGLRGASVKDVKVNLEQMVSAAEKAGAKVLLLGMQIPPNYGTRYVREFGAVFADLATSRKLPYVPFFLSAFGEKAEMFQPDRIHPTAQAQPLMLDAVWPVLARMLPQSAR